jgi:hypothetical protein
MGFASPGDNLHGPNEKFSLRNFERGILTSMAFLTELGRGQNITARHEQKTRQEAVA